MHGLHTCCLNRSGVIACMHDAAPTPECIDGWVDIVLTRGALFRQPSDDERSRLRTYVTDRIAEEPTSGAPREETRHEAAQAALRGA